MGADQELGVVFDRFLCRREPDALQPPAREVLEPLERQREVAAALVARHRVDLVDDHRAHAAERSEEHTSELQSQSNLVCRLLLEKKKLKDNNHQKTTLGIVLSTGYGL